MTWKTKAQQLQKEAGEVLYKFWPSSPMITWREMAWALCNLAMHTMTTVEMSSPSRGVVDTVRIKTDILVNYPDFSFK